MDFLNAITASMYLTHTRGSVTLRSRWSYRTRSDRSHNNNYYICWCSNYNVNTKIVENTLFLLPVVCNWIFFYLVDAEVVATMADWNLFEDCISLLSLHPRQKSATLLRLSYIRTPIIFGVICLYYVHIYISHVYTHIHADYNIIIHVYRY